jgi:hypothetical protein
MIEPLVSLAFSVHSNPGVYALLLGSGVSRSAGIPTGWEVVQDLIRKLALLHAEEPESSDLGRWFKDKYGSEPDYSSLLNELARTPEGRSQLLRSYFEPTEEERGQGIKMPTPAHRAVAELMKSQYVRVVITTNFDRLLETALADLGIQPMVVSTADAVKGAVPLAHARCVIVKINGDYLDSRIKNTKPELSAYDPALDLLLDRVFDEFGLVVCGWSADWDVALRTAIERCPTRRYSVYWASRGDPAPRAAALIKLREAILLPIQTADVFFVSLKDKVLVLSQFAHSHPLSAKIAAEETKRYIVRPEARIRLHDLVAEETERAYAAMDPKRFHAGHARDNAMELQDRLREYESIVEVVLAIVIVGCYWGTPEQVSLWPRILQRIGDPPGGGAGLIAWIGLRRYPASVLMYAGGIAALAGKRYGNLAAILTTTLKGSAEHEIDIAAVCLNAATVMRDGLQKLVPGKQDRHTPFSDHVFETLRDAFRIVLPVDSEYEEMFLLFEYLLALVVWPRHKGWAPIGRCRWRAQEMFALDGSTGPAQPRIAEIAAALFPEGLRDYAQAKAEYDLWALKGTPTWGF